MIIFKLIIALMIILLSGYIGIRKAKKYESREYILKESVTLFKNIQNEIRYMLSTLPNAIEVARQGMKTRLKDVMGSISVELLKYNVTPEVICQEIENLKELSPYDKQVLVSGIISLGQSDVEAQIGIMQNTINTLEAQVEEAAALKKQNSKLYKTVGIATGLMLAIIFI